MQKPYIPDGASLLNPYLSVKDMERSLKFYPRAFQFKVHKVLNDDKGQPTHAELFYYDQAIMIGPCQDFGDGLLQTPAQSGNLLPLSLYLYCSDVDMFYKNAIQEGANPLGEPEDMFWGDRMCRLGDLDGFIWSFATHKS